MTPSSHSRTEHPWNQQIVQIDPSRSDDRSHHNQCVSDVLCPFPTRQPLTGRTCVYEMTPGCSLTAKSRTATSVGAHIRPLIIRIHWCELCNPSGWQRNRWQWGGDVWSVTRSVWALPVSCLMSCSSNVAETRRKDEGEGGRGGTPCTLSASHSIWFIIWYTETTMSFFFPTLVCRFRDSRTRRTRRSAVPLQNNMNRLFPQFWQKYDAVK